MRRRDFIKTVIMGGSVAAMFPDVLTAGFAQAAIAADAWQSIMPGILARIQAPAFPKRDFVITRFGARADGKTDSSRAFKNAIAACNQAGGGRVVVPPGTFLTGALQLKSNVNLYVAKGATVKFSKNADDYLPVVFTRWEGTELMNYSPFIYAFEQKNIAITGAGTLDGQSGNDSWWPWNGRANYGWREGTPNQRTDRTALQEMAEQGVPVSQRVFGAGHYLRPQFIQPYRCTNVLIEGVQIINSPMWEIHPVLCTNVTVRGVKISSHGPNNDGCDPESCTDVLIENCDFDTGDDCIAIKSGRNADGRRLMAPTQNIIVRGCRMRDGHGGITVGSEITGGVRNLFAENCLLDSQNLDHALRVKNNAMRGGVLENFYFRNIEVGEVAHAVITIDFNYEEGAKGSYTPVVRNYQVDRLVSKKSKHAVDLQGLANAPILEFSLSNCTFEKAAEPSIVKNVSGLKLVNVKVNGAVLSQLP